MSNPDQGSADSDLNVDDLMRMKMAQMAEAFESTAVEAANDITTMAVASIAISLKRIANNSDSTSIAVAALVTLGNTSHEQVTGLNSLYGQLGTLIETVRRSGENTSTALHAVERELRNNDGRSLHITVGKD